MPSIRVENDEGVDTVSVMILFVGLVLGLVIETKNLTESKRRVR